jgi:L-ascorbate metabolism protein UlaG (beta-lactamase superfamily)
MITALIIIALLVAGFFLFMRQPRFGRAPSGERLKRLQNSPHYSDGQFRNVSDTPALAEGVTYTQVMREFFFTKRERGKPAVALPSVKTDLFNLNPTDNILVWFGHSSYFMQLDGKRILVDPVLSGHASPFNFTTKAFAGADIYSTEDIPPIDYLFITHDHYDHLDHRTITKLRPKVKMVITGLGVGGHLERWGYAPSIITEMDWNEHLEPDKGFEVHTTTARHFSGRAFKRNNTLWLSFVLKTPRQKIFIGGDSGYDDHFSKIGALQGPFDLVLLENGQYNRNWKYIHMMPEEVVQAAIDLKAEKLMPVHWSKFLLSLHAWDEPIIRVSKEAKLKGMPLVHPVIGEPVNLMRTDSTKEWWQEM